MRDFVKCRCLTPEQLCHGRTFAIDETLFVVEDSAWVLHPAKRKHRREQKVEFAERVGHTEPVAEPVECARVHGDERVALDFGGA